MHMQARNEDPRDRILSEAKGLRDSDSREAAEAFEKWVLSCSAALGATDTGETRVEAAAEALYGYIEATVGERSPSSAPRSGFEVSRLLETLFSKAYEPALGDADAHFICGAAFVERDPLFSPPGDEQEEGGVGGEGFCTAFVKESTGSDEVRLLFCRRFPLANLFRLPYRRMGNHPGARESGSAGRHMKALYEWVLSSPLPSG